MAKSEATPALIAESELEDFAAQQVARGRELWLTHQMTVGGGLCVACGHVYPCDDAEHAAWLVLYWTRLTPVDHEPKVPFDGVSGPPGS